MDFRVFTEPQNGATYDDQLRLALAAEELGFEGYFRSDHFLAIHPGFDGLPGPTDSWVTLAGLAVQTERIRLGTLVSSATFRNPALLAIQVAQVDAMSGGRVELGLGTGWYAAEHAAYGFDFPEKRFGPFVEQLEIISGLWSTPLGETFSYAGDHYALTDSPALPKPVQRGGIPLIIGGNGPRRTPALAAQYAAEYNTSFTNLTEIEARIGRVRAACEAAGRDPETLTISVGGTTIVGADQSARDRRAAAVGADLAVLATDGFTGSSQQIVDRIGALAELGVSRVYAQFLDIHDVEALAEFADTVMAPLG